MRFQPRWFGEPIKSEYLTDRLGANPDGVLAEYAVFNEEAVVALPSHLCFEGAATLPRAAVTAWVALTGHRRVTAGDTVILLSNASKWRYTVSPFRQAGQTSAVMGRWRRFSYEGYRIPRVLLSAFTPPNTPGIRA
jgi:hypothetical protein